MGTVAAASDARPRRYAKEQPTAAPFPPPQADFSLAGLRAIQGVAEGRDELLTSPPRNFADFAVSVVFSGRRTAAYGCTVS